MLEGFEPTTTAGVKHEHQQVLGNVEKLPTNPDP